MGKFNYLMQIEWIEGGQSRLIQFFRAILKSFLSENSKKTAIFLGFWSEFAHFLPPWISMKLWFRGQKMWCRGRFFMASTRQKLQWTCHCDSQSKLFQEKSKELKESKSTFIWWKVKEIRVNNEILLNQSKSYSGKTDNMWHK